MGFTPLEGLVMATRAGNTDPGLLLWLLRDGGLTLDELAEGLEHGSGLPGLAGVADMRDVTRDADTGDPAAVLALEVYLHRLRQLIAGMAAAMDGLDVLVFTGGIGEHQPRIRSRAAPPSSAWSSTSSATRPPRGTPTSARPGRRSRRWWSRRGRTSRSPARSAPC